MKGFAIVVATDVENGIGIQNRLPWSLKADLLHFKTLTTTTQHPDHQNAVLMGRKTWDSLPLHYRPLPLRRNIVISRQSFSFGHDASGAPSLDAALAIAKADPKIEFAFVIGGGMIYEEALRHPHCCKIYRTLVLSAFQCDTVLPEIPPKFALTHESPIQEENGIRFQFQTFEGNPSF